MLTKNLLKMRVYRDRIYPTFVDLDHPQALDLAADMVEQFRLAVGQTAEQLDDMLLNKLGAKSHLPFYPGFKKILMDRCTDGSGGDEEMIQAQRWEKIVAAQNLRGELFFADKEEYQDALRREIGTWADLYCDLPQFLPISAFEVISPEGLVHRYNCALIQGILLQSKVVKISIQNVTLAKKRALFRTMRFFQLLIDDVEQDNDTLSFSIAGPLSLFDSAVSYGMKVANFFPYLLQLSSWSVETDTPMRGKNCRLLVTSQEQTIESHYRDLTGYIPTEFEDFINQYNTRESEWKASIGGDFIQVGKRADCFPDIVFTHKSSGRKVYLELFHKWHRGELGKRLSALLENAVPNLILGISGALAKNEEIKIEMEKFADKKDKLLIFRDFPAFSAIDKVLIGC